MVDKKRIVLSRKLIQSVIRDSILLNIEVHIQQSKKLSLVKKLKCELYKIWWDDRVVMHQFAKLKSLDKGAEVRFLLLPLMSPLLSGKAAVCKTSMSEFDSHRRL